MSATPQVPTPAPPEQQPPPIQQTPQPPQWAPAPRPPAPPVSGAPMGTLVRRYWNENQYAADAARLAQDGYQPAFQPTHEMAWVWSLRGHSPLVTICTLGFNLALPVKRQRLTVTYTRGHRS